MLLIQKKILFYLSVVVFLATGFFITAYAMGYYYDFSDNRFIKTGSVHLDAQINAEVFINDKKEGATSFFGNSFSRNGLLPKEYKIRLEKENYLTWQKNVSVEEGLVSDFPFIYLVKEEPAVNLIKEETISSRAFDFKDSNFSVESAENTVLIAEFFSVSPPNILNYESKNGNIFFIVKFGKEKIFYKIKDRISKENADKIEPEIISSGVEGFKISHDGKKIAWFNKTEVWVYWIEDASYQPYKKTGDKELISRLSNVIQDVHWFEDNNHLFMVTDKNITFAELDGRGGRNTYLIYQSGKITDSVLEKDNSKKVYVSNDDGVISLEI